ncbi:MAG: DUF5723 family protein [Schleiferiaceae bacterium]|nr:DUF5723 family protein [Schleiferiaceae bacterium]MDR9441489.1 DUF5723 family protein [Schleiferiaceae bacterium]
MSSFKAMALSGLLFLSLGLTGQSNMMLYNFDAVPQSLHTNPAMPQQTKVWVGLPVVSGVSLFYHNSGFSAADIFAEGTDINANLAEVTSQLGDNDHLALRQSADLLGVGFKAGKGYVSFGARQVFDFRMDLHKPFFNLLFGPEGNLTNFNMAGFSQETMIRHQAYLGYQYKLSPKLTIGARAKYIFGVGHSYVERSKLSVRQESPFQPAIIETDILVKTSGNTDPNLDNITEELLTENNGLAVDLGFNYELNDDWQVSASFLDWGSVEWTQNNRQYESKGQYEFNGVDIDFSEDDFQDNYEAALDSLEQELNINDTAGVAYDRQLARQIHAGVNWNINKKHSLGALYHARLWEGQTYHDLGLMYRAKLARWFQLTAGYSIINGTYNNVGLGFDLRLGPLQLYVLTDNLLGALQYQEAYTTSVNVGLNLAFYGKKDQEDEEEVSPEEKVKTPKPVPPEAPSDEEDEDDQAGQLSAL